MLLSDYPIKGGGGPYKEGKSKEVFSPLNDWQVFVQKPALYHIYITLNMQFVNYHIMEHQIKLFKRPNLKLVCSFC